MKVQLYSLGLLTSSIFTCLAVPFVEARAQSATEVSSDVLVGEGISGYMDRKHRNPIVSSRTVSRPGSVEILADAYIQNGDFDDAPIQFQFFVNRTLLKTQLRSVELPGAVGVTVTPDVATAPFNYSIVATTLHPNRTFTTVIHGAVFPTDLVATFDCTLALTDTDGVVTEYEASDVTSGQTGSDTLTLSLTEAASIDDSENTIDATATLNDAGAGSTGTLVTTKGDATLTHDVTGTITKSGGTVTAIDFTSSDGLATLTCSASGSTNSGDSVEGSSGSEDDSSASESSGEAGLESMLQ